MGVSREFLVACYTFGAGGGGRRIEVVRQDPAGGWELLTDYDPVDPIANTQESVDPQSPSYLAWHPDSRHVYAVGEVLDGRVWALELDPSRRKLRALGSVASDGDHPCHLAVDPTGTVVISANYSSGSLVVHPIRSDGSLDQRSDFLQHRVDGPPDPPKHPERQQGAHAHMVDFVTDTLVLAVDLGRDAVAAYLLDLDSATLRPAATPWSYLPDGFGPRHLVQLPGDLVAVAGELTGEIALLSLDRSTGGLTVLDVTNGTESQDPSAPSGIAATADGRFVLMANRGPDTVSSFRVVPSFGDELARLELVDEKACGGTNPRDITLVDATVYVANQDSGTVTVLLVDLQTGALSATDSVLSIPSPTHVLPVPVTG